MRLCRLDSKEFFAPTCGQEAFSLSTWGLSLQRRRSTEIGSLSHQKKQLFILDPLESLDPRLDSSLQMAQALKSAGVTVYFTTIDQIFWDSRQNNASCQSYSLDRKDDRWLSGPGTDTELKEFRVIHMRKDPPFDIRYVATTWLLESASEHSKILNSTVGLRKYNEKMAALYFPEYAIPSLISQDANKLFSYFQDECQGDAVLKPLDMYGGRGVEHLTLEKQSPAEVLDVLKSQVSDGLWRQIQPFQKQVSAGEVRAFVSFGEPIAWCLKVPKAGDFLANTRAGATLLDYEPSEAEMAMVVDISLELMKDGIHWVGFDLIGGRVSEINITSPRLLTARTENYPKCFEKMARQIIKFAEI